ncbi:hypothetical protein ONS96_008321 [Cadophora gregata f. sp. sojae]|nr:hypothetical protein ONS96_008321 [Cadophora gregata f. sp. sojae]
MRVRATEIVLAAHRRGELPPDPFPISELGTEFNKPDLGELKAVHNLQHLVQYLQHKLLYPLGVHHCPTADVPDKDDVQGWEVWKNTFHEAAYRSMLVGAVL